MEKIAWSDTSLDRSETVWQSNTVPHSTSVWKIGREPSGLDAARGLIIGLAISQVFWLVLALCVVKFWTYRH